MTSVVTGSVAERPAVDSQNPWPGLIAYEEQFQEYFHGRNQEADELFRRVKRKVLTVLFGRSGLGKTSLLRAGLFPKLRQEGFLPVAIRLDFACAAPELTAQVKSALVHAYQAADLAEATSPDANETLWEYFHRLDVRLTDRAGKPVRPVIVFDQFEELFTLGQSAEAGRHSRALRFFAELADLVENRSPATLEERLEENPELVERFVFDKQDYRILLALREDYLPEIESLQKTMPSLVNGRMRLTRMNERQAFDAVVQPGGAFVSIEVAREIVRFVAGNQRQETNGQRGGSNDTALTGLEVEPSLLSLVCRELNNRRLHDHLDQITPDLLADSSFQRILQDFYDRCVADQPPAVQAFVEDDLLTEAGFRDNMDLGKARQILSERGASAVAIDELVKRRLLHVEDHLGSQRIELTHDVLVPVVKKSRDQRQQQEASRRAEQLRQQERQKARRQRKKLLAVVAGMAALLAIVSSFGVVSFYLYQESKRALEEANRQKSRAEEQTNEAHRQRATALLEKRRADKQTTLANAQTVLVTEQKKVAEDRKKAAEDQKKVAEEQRKLAERQTKVADEQRKNAETERQTAKRERDAAKQAEGQAKQAERQTRLSFDKLQKSFYVLHIGRADQLWHSGNNAGAEELLNECPPSMRGWEWRYLKRLAYSHLFALRGHGKALSNVIYSQDGKYLASASDNGDVEVWEAVTYQHIRTLPEFRMSCNDLAFSPDDRFIAGAGDDKTVKIWEIASAKITRQISGHTDAVVGVAYNSDGTRLATLGKDRFVKVWDLSDGTETDSFSVEDTPQLFANITFCSIGLLALPSGNKILLRDPVQHRTLPPLVLPGSGDRVTAVAFSRDSHFLVAGTQDGLVRVWDLSRGSGNMLRLLRGHTGSISRVVVSPDGKRIASGSWDRAVKVWDLESGAEQATFRGEVGIVTGVAFNRDGEMLAACSGNEIKVWGISGQGMTVLRPDSSVPSVAFSPDGKKLAASGARITVWDTRTSGLLYVLGEAEWYRTVAFNREGTLLAAGTSSGIVEVWNLTRMSPLLYKMPAHVGAVQTLAFHPFRPYLASGGEDKTIGIWNLETGTLDRRLDKHTGEIRSVAFSPNGKLLASSSGDLTARIWDTSNWTERLPKPYPVGNMACLTFVSDDLVASGSGSVGVSGQVKFWNPLTGEDWSPDATKTPLVLRGHGSAISGIAVSKNRLATSSYDGTVKIWDVAAGEELLTLSDPNSMIISSIALSPDGHHLAAGSTHGARIWDASSQEAFVLRGHTNLIYSVAFSPDGKKLASTGNATVKLWNVHTGQSLPRLPMVHSSRIDSAVFSPDGKLVAAACSVLDLKQRRYTSGEVKIWDAATGKPIASFPAHTAAIRWIAFHPSGRFLATASDDATVKIWDVTNGREVRTLPSADHKAEGHTKAINSLSISSDGTRLASASEDKTVKIWDFASGQLIQTLREHQGGVRDVTFSRNGQWLASAGTDRNVILWRNGASIRRERIFSGQIGTVECLAFHPESGRIAAGSDDGTVMGWDIDTGRQVFLFRGHIGAVMSLAYSPDGTYLASGGEDSVVKIWNAEENLDDVFAWHWRLAEDFRSTKQWAQAIAHLDRLIDLEPQNAALLNVRGNVNFSAGDMDKAIDDYTRAIDVPPENVVYYKNRGNAYRMKKDQDAAAADYTRAVAIDPRDDFSYYQRAWVRFQKGDYKGAIEDYSKELEITPNHAGGYGERGLCRVRLRDFDGGIQDFKRDLELDAKDNRAYYWLAGAYYQKGEWAKAMAEYTRELAITPSHGAGYSERAQCKQNLHDLDGAIEDFSRAIALNQKDDTALYLRGGAYFQKGEWAKAMADYTSELAITPDHASGYYDRGQAKFYLNDPNGAIEDFSRAATLAPESAKPLLWRALTRLTQYDWKGSLHDCFQAARLQPGLKKMLEQQRSTAKK